MAYTTRPRTLLYTFLSEHPHAHISMEEILDFARKHSIGTATVYRYVDALCKEGRLCKYQSAGSPCFQWHEADCELYHLVCTACGKCIHVSCPELKKMDTHMFEEHAFRLNLPATVFQGHCAAYAEKEGAR